MVDYLGVYRIIAGYNLSLHSQAMLSNLAEENFGRAAIGILKGYNGFKIRRDAIF